MMRVLMLIILVLSTLFARNTYVVESTYLDGRLSPPLKYARSDTSKLYADSARAASISDTAKKGKTLLELGGEPDAGRPTANGYCWISDTNKVRSWAPCGSGGGSGYVLPTASTGTLGGIKASPSLAVNPTTGVASVVLDSDLVSISGLTGTGYAKRTSTTPTWAVSPTIPATDVTGLASIATTGSASDLATGTVPLARLPSHASTHLAGGSDPIAGQSLSGLRTTDSPVFNAVQAGPAHIGEFAGASGLAWYGKQGYNSPAYLNGMAFDGVSAYLGTAPTGILGIQRGGTTVAKFSAVLNNGFVRGGADASLASSPLAVADLPASIQAAQAIPAGRVALGNGSSGLTSDPAATFSSGLLSVAGEGAGFVLPAQSSYAMSAKLVNDPAGTYYPASLMVADNSGASQAVLRVYASSVATASVEAPVPWSFLAGVSSLGDVSASGNVSASQYVGSLLRITTDVSGHMSAGSLATTIVLASSTGTILDPLPSASFGEESNIGVVVHLLNNTGHSVAYSSLFTIPTGASRTVVWNGTAWE